MSHTLEEVAAIARELTDEEKVSLAERLIADANVGDEDVHASWREEVKRRVEADHAGRLETFTYDEVMRKYRQ